MADEKKRVHAARMLTDKGGRIWVLFDEQHTMRGRSGESQNALLRRWQEAHGNIEILVRIQGVCRPSELAMQIADTQRERQLEQQTCSWCHQVNDVTAGPTLCKECGHRADLARLECDCSQCRTTTHTPASEEPGGNRP